MGNTQMIMSRRGFSCLFFLKCFVCQYQGTSGTCVYLHYTEELKSKKKPSISCSFTSSSLNLRQDALLSAFSPVPFVFFLFLSESFVSESLHWCTGRSLYMQWVSACAHLLQKWQKNWKCSKNRSSFSAVHDCWFRNSLIHLSVLETIFP